MRSPFSRRTPFATFKTRRGNPRDAFNILDLNPAALYRLTTAATALRGADTTIPLAGDPVGLLLDQSQGVEVKSLEDSLGPEIATPENIIAGGGWTSNGDGSFTKTADQNGQLKAGLNGGEAYDTFLVAFTLDTDWVGGLNVFVRSAYDTSNELYAAATGTGRHEFVVKTRTPLNNGLFNLNKFHSSGTLRDLSVRRLKPLSERISGGTTVYEQASIPMPATAGSVQYHFTGVPTTVGRSYLVEFTVADYAGTGDVGLSLIGLTSQNLSRSSKNGPISEIVQGDGTGDFRLFSRGTNTCTFENVRIIELPGNHLSQTVDDDFRPTLVQAGAGYALSFDGIDDYLYAPTRLGLDANPALTVVAVLNTGRQASNADIRIWQIGAYQADNVLAGAIGREGMSWRHNGGAVRSSQLPDSVDVVLSWRRRSGDTYGEGELFVNGEVPSGIAISNTGNIPTDTGEVMYVGGQQGLNSFTGELYSLAIFPATLTDDELRAVESQMVEEAGVTL